MSTSYLALQYQDIKDANPMIPVLALGIVKRFRLGDNAGAKAKRDQFEANYGADMAQALDVCVLFLLYTDVKESFTNHLLSKAKGKPCKALSRFFCEDGDS